MKLRSRHGATSLIMVSFLGVLMIAITGLVGVQALWGKIVRKQLEMDRCTAVYALAFEKTVRRIILTNDIIRALRASAAAAKLVPHPASQATSVAMTRSAQAVALAQDAAIQTWKIGKNAVHVPNLHCESLLGRAEIPAIPYRRLPPDVLGPKPLQFTKSCRDCSFHVVFETQNILANRLLQRLGINNGFYRYAGAIIEGSPHEKNSWRSRWISKREFRNIPEPVRTSGT